MIYFIQKGELGPIKIGFTDDICKRLSNIQTSSDEVVEILAVIEGDRNKEKLLHQQFIKYKIRGEWFNPSIELLTFLDNLQGKLDLEKLPSKNTDKICINCREKPIYIKERCTSCYKFFKRTSTDKLIYKIRV